MSVGFWQILIIVVVVVLLFGRGKISDLMGDVAKGLKSFKQGMADDDEKKTDPRQIPQQPIDVTPRQQDTVTPPPPPSDDANR